MKQRNYLLGVLLAAVLGLAMTACILIGTFMPYVVIPRLDISWMVLVSLAALVPEHYLAPNAGRCWISVPVIGGLAFGLLPLAAGFFPAAEAAKYGIQGAAVFTATTWMFSSACNRLRSGPAGKAAAPVAALGIFLAAQAFLGILI